MKKRMLLLALIVGLVVGLFACVADDEDDDNGRPWTWQRMARYIDEQLGAIATGNNPQCDKNPVTWGTHCKNNLDGKVSNEMVAMMVALKYDCNWPGYDFPDWRPLNADLCTYDGDNNGTADIDEVCEIYGTTAAGDIECDKKGENSYSLKYIECKYQSPVAGCWYNLNGKLEVESYFTDRGELITVIEYKDFQAHKISSAPYSQYKFNGNEVFYKVLDPITGEQMTGTTGNPDGMRILRTTWNVDYDGPGQNVPGQYKIKVADDEEDGLALLGSYGKAVWYDEAFETKNGNTIKMKFYDRDFPWNDLPNSGCKVDAVNINPTQRTFDIESQGPYSGDGCLPDKQGLSY